MGRRRDRSYKSPVSAYLELTPVKEDAGEAAVFADCPKTGAAIANNMTKKNRIEV